jgi:hypothetical protein
MSPGMSRGLHARVGRSSLNRPERRGVPSTVPASLTSPCFPPPAQPCSRVSASIGIAAGDSAPWLVVAGHHTGDKQTVGGWTGKKGTMMRAYSNC